MGGDDLFHIFAKKMNFETPNSYSNDDIWLSDYSWMDKQKMCLKLMKNST